MTYATINGRMAYPAAGTDIKIVVENPFMKEQGNHTYQVSFPLGIAENRRVFGCVDRKEVSRRGSRFDDCALFSGSVCLLRGSATVLTYSDEDVKLQFLGSASDAKARLEGVYIDELDYPEVEEPYRTWCRKTTVSVPTTLASAGYGGIRGRYVFFTVGNESTGQKYNRLRCWSTPMQCEMKRPVLQVGLVWVLHQVFQSMGYRVSHDAYDTAPWNDLYIVSVRRSATVAGALPHWKAATLLEEFRKLFNAVYIYDEVRRTVSIESYDSIGTFGTVAVECEQAFTSEYDEEGVAYIGSDNIAYDLVGCADQETVREIPKEVLNTFALKKYATLAELLAAAGGMGETERLTTLFLAENAGYVYFRKMDEKGTIGYTTCGYFSPLIREVSSGNTTELKIIPAPMGQLKVNASEIEDTCLMPSIEGPEWGAAGADDEVVTLQDVLEDEVSVEAETEDDHLPVAFLAAKSSKFIYDNRSDRYYAVMRSLADMRESNLPNDSSLALANPGSVTQYVGRFHSPKAAIDTQNQFMFRFLSDTIPNPCATFIIQNKRFLCAKVEASVGDSGIDRLMTGYFYEML